MKNQILHGLLLIDKESGMSSHDVVARVRKIMKTKEVGHCGTLDPLASGLMVILLNEATKLSHYLLEKNKSYDVQLKFGLRTDTLDITGKILTESQFQLNQDEIIQAALSLQGDFHWAVPKYSAMKVNGQKLHEMARANEKFEAPKKVMSFWGVENLGIQNNEVASFRIHCSKGSFIRTWVSQLGDLLGCGATMTGLRRLSSEPYFLKDAVTLDHLAQVFSDEAFADQKEQLPFVVPIENAIPTAKKLWIKGQDEVMLRNGQISHDLRISLILLFNPDVDQFVLAMSQGTELPLALIGLEPEKGFVVRRGFRFERS